MKTKPRFVGLLDFAPMDPSVPELWKLEQPFGQLTSDGHLIVCPPDERINGASIPDFLQPWLGHPFDDANKYWSVPHDVGYHDKAVILTPEDLHGFAPETFLLGNGKIFNYDPFRGNVRKSRYWFDKVAVEGMKIKKQPLWKRVAVYSGIRLGGWGSWKGK